MTLAAVLGFGPLEQTKHEHTQPERRANIFSRQCGIPGERSAVQHALHFPQHICHKNRWLAD